MHWCLPSVRVTGSWTAAPVGWRPARLICRAWPYSRGLRWRVALAGEEPDLAALAHMFPSGRFRRPRRGRDLPDRTRLTMRRPGQARASPSPRVAPQSRRRPRPLQTGDYWHVTLSVASVTLTPHRTPTSWPVPSPRRSRPVGRLGQGETRTATWCRGRASARSMLARSTSDPALHEALRWMGAPVGPDWAHLWKAFEFLRHAAGGSGDDLVNRWGATRDDIDSFRSSANDPAISGDLGGEARRWVEPGPSRSRSFPPDLSPGVAQTLRRQ